MKTNSILQTLIMLFIVLTTSAQQGINYKAIINDANGNVLANTAITMQFTILENGTTLVYSETHNSTTDANGIIIVNIGEGSSPSSDFSAIDWGSNPHFLKTEIDIGNGFSDLGTTEFKAVPYSLYANKVADKDDADADPTNEIQILKLDGNKLSISRGNTIILESESDPFFNSSVASSINQKDTLKWNMAYNWGNHEEAGYLTDIPMDKYKNMIIVAKSGGDFTDISQAIDSIKDARQDNPYMVWVAPGIYEDTVQLKPYIHLKGAGQESTKIISMGSPTVSVNNNTSISTITIINNSNTETGSAISVRGINVEIRDINIIISGNPTTGYGIYTYRGLRVSIKNVNISLDGSFHNRAYGIYNEGSERIILFNSSIISNKELYKFVGIYNRTTDFYMENCLIKIENFIDAHGVYNDTYSNFNAHHCNIVINSIYHGTEAIGIEHLGEDFQMSNCYISVKDSEFNTGITSNTNITIDNSSIICLYGNNNSTIKTSGKLLVRNCILESSGATTFNQCISTVDGKIDCLNSSFNASYGENAIGLIISGIEGEIEIINCVINAKEGLNNTGLHVRLNAVANCENSSIKAIGGQFALATHVHDEAILSATQLTLVANNGLNNHSLINDNGIVDLRNSVLQGDAIFSNCNCTAITYETDFFPSGCP